MIGSKVEHGEHVLVVVDLRTIVEREAHTLEDVDDLVTDKCQRMASAKVDGVGSACEVEALRGCLGGLHLLAERVDLVGGCLFQFVDLDAQLALFLFGHIAEICNDGVDFAFLTEIFQSELLHILSVFG